MSKVPCQFCASPLPINTLVCTYCKQRNPIPSLYQKRESVDNTDNITCVECQTNTIKLIDIGDYEESLTTLQCSTCKGMFISFELFEKTIHHYGVKRKKPPTKITAPDEKIRNQDKLYPCPICNQTMKRFLYKISSNVIIDKCEEHGVWLNHGELRTLIEWKQSIENSKDIDAMEKAYREYGLKKVKSSYTYQKDNNSRFESFLEWLLGA